MKNKNKQTPKAKQLIKYGKDVFEFDCITMKMYVPYENHGIKNRYDIGKPYLLGFCESQAQVLN